MKFRNYINITQGTDSVPEFSNGNTLPLVALPHGMNHYSLETREADYSLFYNPSDTSATGIRLTHMPSPWINDYGQFTMIASAGDGVGKIAGRECRSPLIKQKTVMKPWELKAALKLFGSEMILVPTMRGALLQMKWKEKCTRRFCLTHFGDKAVIEIDSEKQRIYGYTSVHNWPINENFKMYYTITFDAQFDMEKTYAKEGENASVNLAFAGEEGIVTARIATSFISLEQAKQNLASELLGRTIDELRENAEEIWEREISRIKIDADDSIMRTFYSCLYRMRLFPRVFHEYDAAGKAWHYSPDSGKVFKGTFYTDNGFWDTYKTVYPLYSLILPDFYYELCESFCNYFDESGWLPRWMSPGAVNCMPGTAIDAVFGDAAAKDVVNDSVLLSRMLASTMHHVKNVAENPAYGRDGVESFNKLGWVSADHLESVNKTQDYAYGDFCIAQIARKLKQDDLAKELTVSSLRYRNLYDSGSGFLRARDEKGKMREDWTPIQWGMDYTEGSAWQNSLAMYHDFGGLARLMGGKEKLEAHLDALFGAKPEYDTYGYGTVIHEMREMAAVDFGQCAMSNQPSFHIPYIYSCIGIPEKTAYWTRRIMSELFSDSPTGFPGDEDNGSMAGWYVFSALGFYPVCPGVPEYVLGSPIVRSAEIELGNGNTLFINAHGQSNDNFYVSSVKLNGKTVERTYLCHDELMNGGEIVYIMSCKPVKREYKDEELPYSVER